MGQALLQRLAATFQLGPGGVEQCVADTMDAGAQRLGRAVAIAGIVQPADVTAYQVETVVAFRPQVPQVTDCGLFSGEELAHQVTPADYALGLGYVRFPDIGEGSKAAVAVDAEPGAAGAEIPSGQQLRGIGQKPAGRLGRAKYSSRLAATTRGYCG